MAFNVSVDKGETPKASDDEGTGEKDGGKTKSRVDGDKAVSAGGFCSSPAAAAANRKIAASPSPIRPRSASAKSQHRIGLEGSNSLTTPVGFCVS